MRSITDAIYSYSSNDGEWHNHIVYCDICGAGPYTIHVYPLNRSSASPQPDNPFASCFIATAAYENPHAIEVEILRNFRDIYLLSNPLTAKFVDFYYFISPSIAHYIEKSEILKMATRTFLTPIVIAVYPFTFMPEAFEIMFEQEGEEKKGGKYGYTPN